MEDEAATKLRNGEEGGKEEGEVHPFEATSSQQDPASQDALGAGRAAGAGVKGFRVLPGAPALDAVAPPASDQQPRAGEMETARLESQDSLSVSSSSGDPERKASHEDVIKEHVNFAAMAIAKDASWRRHSYSDDPTTHASPSLHTHAYYNKKWHEAMWYAEQKTAKNQYTYANTKQMSEDELREHQDKIKNNLRLQNLVAKQDENSMAGGAHDGTATGMPPHEVGSPVSRAVQSRGDSMSQLLERSTSSQWKESVGKLADSKVMRGLLTFSCLFIAFAETLATIINPEWARRDALLILQLLCFICIAAENICRLVTSGSYRRRTAFFCFVILAVFYIFEIIWIVGNTDLLQALGFDQKHSNLGWRIIQWVIRVTSFCFVALRFGARHYLLIREMEERDRSVFSQEMEQMEGRLALGSILGTRLQYLIYRDVVIAMGMLLVLQPCISTATQPNRFGGIKSDLESLVGLHHSALQDPAGAAIYQNALNGFVESKHRHKGSEGMEVLMIRVSGEIAYGADQEKEHPLEHVRIRYQADTEGQTHTIEVLFNDLDGLRLDAIGHVVSLMIFSILVGAFTKNLLTSLRNDIVEPMEDLIDLVSQLAFQPMRPIVSKLMQKEKSGGKFRSLGRSDYEVVHVGLQRVGSLLQMGFGEAGARIVRDLMQSGNLNYNNLPGHVTKGIFGFCDIRNFTDLTEVLQSDVSKVVNSVAVYVHEAVVDNHGAPNKNIGDAFLMAWKPKEGLRLETQADASLRSVIRTIIEISRSEALEFWANHAEIQKRMPGFRIKLGFGLHYGWAIECAIGSKRKLEASYLSPHVNMSSRLESATKMFGVEILISKECYNHFSDQVQGHCRLIDIVTLKGSEKPMSLYTYDVPALSKFGGPLEDYVGVSDKDMSNEDFFGLVRPALTEEFRSTFDEAVTKYLGGNRGVEADWIKAKELIDRCLQLKPGDGPCENLHSVITSQAASDGSVPHDWIGYRKLTEK